MWQRYEDGAKSLAPDTTTYTIMANVLCKSSDPDAGQKATELLEEMWNRTRIDEGLDVKPNHRVYSGVLSVWSKSSDSNSVENATKIIKEMWQQYDAGDKSFAPTAWNYNSLIFLISNSDVPGSGQRAEDCLREMWKRSEISARTRPNVHTYNEVLDAIANGGGPDARKNCQRILDEMWHRYNDGDVRLAPDTKSYNHLMIAIVKDFGQDCGNLAENALREMCTLQESHPTLNLKPNAVMFNRVAAAFSKSGFVNATAKASSLLEELHPNISY
eukprot:CAMPEP_0116834632 /NCGR_PEP_ID=MMETSP0418-20121206/7096_1 /TAXON_ID=1158023 /ORGANISM="Astrosyne radiata, Strain 13vi08-1A" /LENGTH=272 /DNA_ID=CAMNT_0004464207 /DNA_START=1 /DNA_END=819 /DNA_ORIENTATION=+